LKIEFITSLNIDKRLKEYFIANVLAARDAIYQSVLACGIAFIVDFLFGQEKAY
jgi:hypothetical protein